MMITAIASWKLAHDGQGVDVEAYGFLDDAEEGMVFDIVTLDLAFENHKDVSLEDDNEIDEFLEDHPGLYEALLEEAMENTL